MITIDELKSKINKLGYFADEELLFDTYNALCLMEDNNIHFGQDIFAICLEGPPGAGKTEFAKVYTKVCDDVFKGNVKMVDYQCDATTGKTELFEDINISAAIRGDADGVNIPGKLVEAIKATNAGNRVILFIDEYDKAREETDAFLLQFLQSGKINSTQHGDLEVKDIYKHNLQVILCKNDMREELSGPLSRRIRIVRLDYMRPDIFYQVAHRNLVENKDDNAKVNDGLLNLVTLMYEQAYKSRELFDRLPSCSEMLIALEDADRLLKRANAPQYIVYNTIVRNMFKSVDDIKTFEKVITKAKNSGETKLFDLIENMKSRETTNAPVDLNSLIAKNVFTTESENLRKKASEIQALIDEYSRKFAEMEEKRRAAIQSEVEKISLENGKLISTSSMPNVIKNFEDESSLIKRGYNIFSTSSNDWVDVGEVQIPDLSHHHLIDKLCRNASMLDVKIYENGVLLRDDGETKLIVVCDTDDSGVQRYRFMANQAVIPSTFLSDVKNFIAFVHEAFGSQAKTGKQITNAVIGDKSGVYSLNTLVYNDNLLDLDTVGENIYHANVSGVVGSTEKLDDIISNSVCSDPSLALSASQKIMNGKGKVKSYE